MPRTRISIVIVTLLIFFIACSDNQDPSPAATSLTKQSDVQYGTAINFEGESEILKLDLYFPDGATTEDKFPLVVMIHGGGYVAGDKDDMKGNCAILADSGFVVASLNYRMGWNNGTHTCDGDPYTQRQAAYRALQDSNAALRFLVSNASSYAIDTDWIFIGGNSAGASLSLNTAYVTNEIALAAYPDFYDAFGPLNTSGNSLTSTFTIKGVCNMWGALPDSTLINENSALPTISFHGTADGVVPYDIGHQDSCENYPIVFGSVCIHRQLLHYNKPVITNLVKGGGHGPDVYKHEFLMGNTACFFKRIIHGVPIGSRVDLSLISSCN